MSANVYGVVCHSRSERSYVTIKKTNTNICECVQSFNKKKNKKIKGTMGKKKKDKQLN